jgi:hypothetical protein
MISLLLISIAMLSQTVGVPAFEVASVSPTFALKRHFHRWCGRIAFAFSGGVGETGQVKTLPLF